jgi:hypothetical protein
VLAVEAPAYERSKLVHDIRCGIQSGLELLDRRVVPFAGCDGQITITHRAVQEVLALRN